MAVKPNATVCGIPTSLGGAVNDHGGRLATGVGPTGHWRAISKPGARRLLQALFGHERLPRLGHSIKLCDDQYLDNVHTLQVRRTAPGEMRGTRRSHVRKR